MALWAGSLLVNLDSDYRHQTQKCGKPGNRRDLAEQHPTQWTTQSIPQVGPVGRLSQHSLPHWPVDGLTGFP